MEENTKRPFAREEAASRRFSMSREIITTEILEVKFPVSVSSMGSKMKNAYVAAKDARLLAVITCERCAL